ncbi:MAG: glycosyltransferase [Candidatus Liptonbacteria bacterium]|nr:glycosyltransferase [Candidatus Liptonbacteria bacterium]
MNPLNAVVAVIRSYNNPAVVKQVNSLRSFLSRIVVVTDFQRDRGATKAWLDEVNDPCVNLIEMSEGYSWANALNRAIDYMQLFNAQRTSAGQFDYIFNVSVEARFEQEHVKQMIEKFDDSSIGVVGTTFRGTCEGNEVSLGLSYRHPRNTGMLVRLSAFSHRMTRDFDGFCDDVGGMEDIDFICRMEVFTEYKADVLDLRVPLIVGRHYNQTDKESRERAAMEKIFARYRTWQERISKVVEKFS